MTDKHFFFCATIGIFLSLVTIKILYFDVKSQNKLTQKYSSVWCFGNNASERQCRFKNLCYSKETDNFIFIYHENDSWEAGIPVDRFSPALVDLSSVSNHNKFYFNYVELPHTSLGNFLENKTLTVIKGRTLIFGRFKPDNIMHLIHDDILPAYFTNGELNALNSFFFYDQWPSNSHPDFSYSHVLYRLLFENISIFVKSDFLENGLICFEEAFVGISKKTTWYQYGFRKPQSPIKRSTAQSFLISQTIKKIKAKLLKNFKCKHFHVVLLSRKKTRLILNEEILIQQLTQLTNMSVVKIRIEELTNFEDVVRTISCARVLIGIHGSGLVLTMFLPPNAALIELFPFAINPTHFSPYKTLANLKGLHLVYNHWRNVLPNNTITHEDFPLALGGLSHLSAEERQAIVSNYDDIPPHLCCSDPRWLFRIYQDTYVDPVSFEKTIRQTLNDISKMQSQERMFGRLIAPGPVINLKCSSTNTQVTISWDYPWNCKYAEKRGEIFFTVLIREKGTDSALSFKRWETIFNFTNAKARLDVWVSCTMAEVRGPFNNEALNC